MNARRSIKGLSQPPAAALLPTAAGHEAFDPFTCAANYKYLETA
jgi:hypothetical protein